MMKKDFKKLKTFEQVVDRPDIQRGIGYIEKLKQIKDASVKDFSGGKGILWILKRIILDQEERIRILEFKIAELRNEIEEEDY